MWYRIKFKQELREFFFETKVINQISTKERIVHISSQASIVLVIRRNYSTNNIEHHVHQDKD